MLTSPRTLFRPKIILVGAGRFGLNHLRVLKELDRKGRISFLGVVVRKDKKRREIASEFSVETYSALTPALLKKVDAVDIVTPPETHFQLVKNSLRYTNVFVEKPLATNLADALRLGKIAEESKRVLMVGHIFRFHPVVKRLAELLKGEKLPIRIVGSFVNPISSDPGREPSLEMLHLFDIVDFLWNKKAKSVQVKKEGRVSLVKILYDKNIEALFSLGWFGKNKERFLKLFYPDFSLEADLLRNTVTSERAGSKKIYSCNSEIEPLTEELTAFVEALGDCNKNPIDHVVGARIVSIAERAI